MCLISTSGLRCCPSSLNVLWIWEHGKSVYLRRRGLWSQILTSNHSIVFCGPWEWEALQLGLY